MSKLVLAQRMCRQLIDVASHAVLDIEPRDMNLSIEKNANGENQLELKIMSGDWTDEILL